MDNTRELVIWDHALSIKHESERCSPVVALLESWTGRDGQGMISEGGNVYFNIGNCCNHVL